MFLSSCFLIHLVSETFGLLTDFRALVGVERSGRLKGVSLPNGMSKIGRVSEPWLNTQTKFTSIEV